MGRAKKRLQKLGKTGNFSRKQIQKKHERPERGKILGEARKSKPRTSKGGERRRNDKERKEKKDGAQGGGESGPRASVRGRSKVTWCELSFSAVRGESRRQKKKNLDDRPKNKFSNPL